MTGWRSRAALLVMAFAALAGGCGEEPETVAQGYIEGDFLFIAAEQTGRIAELPVSEGDAMEAGALLVRLDTAVEDAALAAAEDRARRAGEQLADLERGARPQRLAVLDAAIAQREAELELARARLARRQSIAAGPAVSPEELDEAEADFEAAQAALREAREERELAALAARRDRIDAAEAELAAARAEAERRRRVIDERSVHVPSAGLVQELVRRRGEVAPAGGTVAVFLPDDARRAVFFVSQAQLPALSRGEQVGIACDGCPAGLTAPVSFIASEVVFTPPVIFGPQERERLLIRVEAAIPPEAAPGLHPGQPITVTLPSAPETGDG